MSETFLQLTDSEELRTELLDIKLNDRESVDAYKSQTDHNFNVISFNKTFVRYFEMHTRIKGETTTVLDSVFEWLVPDRDYLYSSSGVHLMKTRYCLPDEPLQFCNLRMALVLTNSECFTFEEWRMFYEVLSLGYVHLSSNYAKTTYDRKSFKNDAFNAPVGEACRLVVIRSGYDHRVLKQIQEINSCTSAGVGVGVCASNVPRNGLSAAGKIQTGFLSFLRAVDSSLSLYNRRAKVAVYLHVHVDTVLDALEVKLMSNLDRLENVFIGLMFNETFMKALDHDEFWHLYPADCEFRGVKLNDLVYDQEKYAEALSVLNDSVPQRFTNRIRARDLMNRVVKSILCSGSPYVIWSEFLNKYNNVAHLGPIRTLNLCSEICNFTEPGRDSSCTLMTCNIAAGGNFTETDNGSRFMKYCEDRVGSIADQYVVGLDSKYVPTAKFAFALGFVSCVGLNNVLGSRTSREIGITPCGMFDSACLNGFADCSESIVEHAAIVSEMLYKGAVHGSVYFAKKHKIVCQNWLGSGFSNGKFQFDLRNVADKCLRTDWTHTRDLVTHNAMANSLLTAQAPTASTSRLFAVCESVTLPIAVVSARVAALGLNKHLPLGLRFCIENGIKVRVDCSVKQQLNMYTRTAPFVDHSQSTTVHMELSAQNVYNLLMATRATPGFEMKTALYYILAKVRAPSLKVIRKNDFEQNLCDGITDEQPQRRSLQNNNSPNPMSYKTKNFCTRSVVSNGNSKQDYECDSCSM